MTELQQTGPGRPAIGEPIKVRLGEDLQVLVDQWAAERGVARAEAIRQLITAGLAAPVDELARLFPEYVGEDQAERDYLIWDQIYQDGTEEINLQLGWVEGGNSGYDIELGAVYVRGAWVLFRTVTPAGKTIAAAGDITVEAHTDEEIIDAYRTLLATTTDEYFDPERGPLWNPDASPDGQFGFPRQGSGTVSWEGVIDPATVEGMVEPLEEPAPWEI